MTGLELTQLQDEWSRMVRRSWSHSPAMAVHMAERFKIAQVQTEVSRLVRGDPRAVIHVAEALHFLLGDRLEPGTRRGLQYLPLWAPVPPVTALVYFHPRYQNHPAILQYAMRVLEQHPVDLTFFFVPQVVQALRSDGLGESKAFFNATLRLSRLRRRVYLRDVENLTALLSSDHLEHES
jgi:phosphatidylinositol 4-kinase